jgi:hypothetical protein
MAIEESRHASLLGKELGSWQRDVERLQQRLFEVAATTRLFAEEQP